MIIDEKGNHVKYNPEGLIIGKDGNLYDKRGYKVVEDENGKKYYDENGY